MNIAQALTHGVNTRPRYSENQLLTMLVMAKKMLLLCKPENGAHLPKLVLTLSEIDNTLGDPAYRTNPKIADILAGVAVQQMANDHRFDHDRVKLDDEDWWSNAGERTDG
jgi:hypothetical protein